MMAAVRCASTRHAPNWRRKWHLWQDVQPTARILRLRRARPRTLHLPILRNRLRPRLHRRCRQPIGAMAAYGWKKTRPAPCFRSTCSSNLRARRARLNPPISIFKRVVKTPTNSDPARARSTCETTEQPGRSMTTAKSIKAWKHVASLSPAAVAVKSLASAEQLCRITRRKAISLSRDWWPSRFRSSLRAPTSPAGSLRCASAKCLSSRTPDSGGALRSEPANVSDQGLAALVDRLGLQATGRPPAH
jgi:hypothetical protein